MPRPPALLRVALLALPLLAAACDSSDPGEARVAPDTSAVVATYADLAFATYEDTYTAAATLDAAIDAFLADPSAGTLEAARDAWKAARQPYAQAEAFRFAGGPIDDEALRARISAQPIDEAYVDYVAVPGDRDRVLLTGIVNDPDAYPTLDADLLLSLNGRGGDANVSLGYHVLEFLLWGQDLSPTGPGDRPFTDYVPSNTVPSDTLNAARRATYLDVASDRLLVDLAALVEAWDPSASGSYREAFLARDPAQALGALVAGIWAFSRNELAFNRLERPLLAVANQEPVNEVSRFSDHTRRDLIANAEGVANIYRGRYVRLDGSVVSGASLSDLVAAANAALGASVDASLSASIAAVEDIPNPFDRAVVSSQPAINLAVDVLEAQGEVLVAAAAALGYTLGG